MAPYSLQTDVADDFKDMDFSATGNIKDDQVTQFIAEADALIDSYVGMRYVVPVASPASSLALLKMYSRNLVANRIKAILEVKQATNTDANQNVRSGLSTAAIIKLLEAIRDGDTILPGAELIDETGAGFYSSNYEQGVVPQFHKDSKEW